MFNWLGNIFPYSDLHSLNLDWLLSKMKETAAQAAKAVADAANALAQVAEAKAAALSAQTAAQNAQTAANNAQTAADNAATSAENAVSVAQAAKSAAQTAQSTADAAKSAAQTAQNTANTAQSAAQTAQSAAQTAQNAAETAQTAAENAQTAAENAQTTANSAMGKFPIKDEDIKRETITGGAIANNTITKNKLKSVMFNVYDPVYSNFYFEATVAQLNAGTTPITASSSTFTYNTLAIDLTGSYTIPGSENKTHYLSLRSGVFTRPQSSSYVEIDVKLTDLFAPDIGGEETIRSYSGKFIIKTVGTVYKMWFTFNNTIDAADISEVELSGFIRYLSAV